MRKQIFALIALAMITTSGMFSPCFAYPERPESARVVYELWYFPMRVLSMVSAVTWDIPTATFQDGVKGAIGGTKMVARNLGNEDGAYEMVAGSLTGGPIGLVVGSLYGSMHGAYYGTHHGFIGYPSPHSGSHSMIFQGKGFVVPYDDNY